MPRIHPRQELRRTGLDTYRNTDRVASTSDKKADFSIHRESSPKIPTVDPNVLVYNILNKKCRKERLSKIAKQNVDSSPPLELSMASAPLLVDGRMYIIDIPRWRRLVDFPWRTTQDGRKTHLESTVVTLPAWVWLERNFQGRWKVMWIERA